MNKIMALLIALMMGLSLQAKETVLDIYNDNTTIVLSTDNTLVLREVVSNESVSRVMKLATKMNANLKSGYPMYLFLYTPGGSIQAGLELMEFMKGLNRPVHTITMFAASMGFQIVQNLGIRYVLKFGVMMSHKAKGSFSGNFGGGLSQLDARYGLWLRRIDILDRQTVKRTKGKQTLKSYRAAYQNELWLNGKEAVSKGYADKIASVKCDISMNGTYVTIINRGFFKYKIYMSSCPIKTYPIKIVPILFTNQGEMELNKFLLKDGIFGDECLTSRSRDQVYWTQQLSKAIKPKLCAKDKTLTLYTINKGRESILSVYSKDLKNNIKYSY